MTNEIASHQRETIFISAGLHNLYCFAVLHDIVSLPLRLLHKTKLGWINFSVLLRRHWGPRGRKTSRSRIKIKTLIKFYKSLRYLTQ